MLLGDTFAQNLQSTAMLLLASHDLYNICNSIFKYNNCVCNVELICNIIQFSTIIIESII